MLPNVATSSRRGVVALGGGPAEMVGGDGLCGPSPCDVEIGLGAFVGGPWLAGPSSEKLIRSAWSTESGTLRSTGIGWKVEGLPCWITRNPAVPGAIEWPREGAFAGVVMASAAVRADADDV